MNAAKIFEILVEYLCEQHVTYAVMLGLQGASRNTITATPQLLATFRKVNDFCGPIHFCRNTTVGPEERARDLFLRGGWSVQHHLPSVREAIHRQLPSSSQVKTTCAKSKYLCNEYVAHVRCFAAAGAQSRASVSSGNVNWLSRWKTNWKLDLTG